MNTPTTPSAFSVVYGGEDLAVRLLDNTIVLVRVRAMPVRHLGRVLHLADKEAELLDFVCYLPREGAGYDPLPAGWADNLSEEGHLKLYEAAKRLNFSRAAAWAERQIAAKQLTGELALKAEETLMPMLQQIAGLLGSLPKPSATPEPAATTRS